jgi:mono/diheme cytochrome c family protein
MSRRPRVPTFVLSLAAVLFVACNMLPWFTGGLAVRPTEGTSASNGERIYFAAVSERTGRIDYRGGPPGGGMMMGSWGLACVSCHGADGRGGVHAMHMLLMDAPDIRWSTLASDTNDVHQEEAQAEAGQGEAMAEYDLAAFRMAVVEGQHPDGLALSLNMPRWDLDEEDLADLAEFLRSLP